MALNYLLARHQLSVVAGRTAASPEARIVHKALARAYAGRVQALQRALGATAVLGGRA